MADQKPTADLILRKASHLFSVKGFEGTSTRQIADAVGIRQPSLFHHFKSKAAIAEALFAYDCERSPLLRGQLELPDAEPAVTLYQMVRREVETELTSAYDLRGLYLTSVIDRPEFARWKLAYDTARTTGRSLLARGVATGDFIDHNIDLAGEIIGATLWQTIHWPHEKRPPADADEVAGMMLRMVLAHPGKLPAVRRAADHALLALRSLQRDSRG
ncbi:TetR/AcrR family transcriptional regulator [Streptomyces capitiformicae]|uniref:TetR family transcriptional regulator n=1 Tax=Streptomyces capitiformicae TaxID=2014920 RepID=A0A919DQN4_9ACTN|nr:TetR/AcrR family transcriptional regulator [Streptomyces capitiformicae]GHE66299.1 TetR family transcriptional regulator [Streptomyces capitiformicae]